MKEPTGRRVDAVCRVVTDLLKIQKWKATPQKTGTGGGDIFSQM